MLGSAWRALRPLASDSLAVRAIVTGSDTATFSSIGDGTAARGVAQRQSASTASALHDERQGLTVQPGLVVLGATLQQLQPIVAGAHDGHPVLAHRCLARRQRAWKVLRRPRTRDDDELVADLRPCARK